MQVISWRSASVNDRLLSNMDHLERYYGKQTFFLYSLFAKVPETKAWPRQIFTAVSILLLSLAVVYQLIKLVVERFNRDVIIELLPTISATGGTLIYVPYLAFNTEKDYEAMLSIMLNDLRSESTEEEDAIRTRYAKTARILINVLTLIFGLGLCFLPLLGFVPNILDLIIPLNESRKRELFINGEFFIDQEKYFSHIYVVESCVVLVMGIILGVSENMGMIVGQHYCCMIEVLGTRLKNITQFDDQNSLDKDDYDNIMAKRLRVCISGHQTIIQFSMMIADFYDIPLTLVLIGTFSALIASLVQITDVELVNTMMVCFTIMQVVQLFLLSYMGQAGSDATNEISVYAYDTCWYLCPPKLQNCLQLMILRASKPYMVIARGMYALTLASFMSVMQTVTSFYMVLRHTS